MTKRRALIVPAVILGILLLALGVLYIAEPASSLPSALPGHQAGSGHHHVKHGIAALLLAAAAFVYAWFQTGPAASRGRSAQPVR
jgi:NADH:ubiquinone oxidoreductase subunit 5 (subunit L)/multisubunit Na+/H+ antiporter MnhA subunit